MAKRKSFYLYKRKKKGGEYWYAIFIDPETGAEGTARSVDVLKEKLGMGSGYAVTDRDSAAVIASKAIEAGIATGPGRQTPFSEWCLGFWDWEKSEYVKLRNSLPGSSMGEEYCRGMSSLFRHHVEPFVPKGIKLSAVGVPHLEKVLAEAFRRGYAPGTVQLISLSFSLPLKEAERRRMIPSNPASRIVKVARLDRERGILEEREISSLAIAVARRPGDRAALAVKLAMSTGMRLSEVRALSTSDITLSGAVRGDGESMARIRVAWSLAPYSGRKCVKNRRERFVYVPDSLARELLSGADGEVVFPGKRSKWMSATLVRGVFYGMLEEIGIGEGERKERNITFHSLRHVFNTFARDHGIVAVDRMLALGHGSEKVNTRYLHDSERSLLKTSEATSAILALGGAGCAEKCSSGAAVAEDQL